MIFNAFHIAATILCGYGLWSLVKDIWQVGKLWKQSAKEATDWMDPSHNRAKCQTGCGCRLKKERS